MKKRSITKLWILAVLYIPITKNVHKTHFFSKHLLKNIFEPKTKYGYSSLATLILSLQGTYYTTAVLGFIFLLVLIPNSAATYW